MLYAIKLGPIETDEGRVHAYVGIRDDGSLAATVLTHRDKDALRELVASAAPGQELCCEPRLARAGASLGFSALEMPAWVPEPRAAIAAVIALGPERLPGDRDGLQLLFVASTEFWRAKPWRYWSDDEPIEVVVTGAREATLEGALMGAAGMEHGVALYRRPGALQRIARSLDRGRMHEAMREPSIAVTFDDEPRFAILALRKAYGLAHLPVPIRVERGHAEPVDAIDLRILGATLHLLATVTPDQRRATRTLELDLDDDELELAIEITMPPLLS